MLLQEDSDDEFFCHCDHCSFETLYEHQLDIHVKLKHPLKSNLKRKSEKSSDQIATKKSYIIFERTKETKASFNVICVDIRQVITGTSRDIQRLTKDEQSTCLFSP